MAQALNTDYLTQWNTRGKRISTRSPADPPTVGGDNGALTVHLVGRGASEETTEIGNSAVRAEWTVTRDGANPRWVDRRAQRTRHG